MLLSIVKRGRTVSPCDIMDVSVGVYKKYVNVGGRHEDELNYATKYISNSSVYDHRNSKYSNWNCAYNRDKREISEGVDNKDYNNTRAEYHINSKAVHKEMIKPFSFIHIMA